MATKQWYDNNREKWNEYQRKKAREYAAKRKAEKIAMQTEIEVLRKLLEKQMKGE